VVDVEHRQRQRPPVPLAPRQLALEELDEEALVVDAGQAVHDGHPVDLLVVRHLDVVAGQELEDGRADLEEVSVAQRRFLDRLVVHVRAVGRSEVLHLPGFEIAGVAGGAEDPRVAARHRITVDLDVAIVAAPDDELRFVEGEALAHLGARRVDEDETRPVCRALWLGHLDLGDPCLPLAHR
jgi:hypothetical protein